MGEPVEPERVLIRAVRSGDPAALECWYRAEHPRVWKLCLGFLADANRADDVAQDAMLHLLDRLDTFDERRDFGAWRTAAVLNFCRDRMRRSEARRRAEERAGQDGAGAAGARALPDPGAEAERGELRAALLEALARLTPREREAFVLRELEGHSAAETAAALGIGEGSVRTLLTLARRRLRALLAPRLGYAE